MEYVAEFPVYTYFIFDRCNKRPFLFVNALAFTKKLQIEKREEKQKQANEQQQKTHSAGQHNLCTVFHF